MFPVVPPMGLTFHNLILGLLECSVARVFSHVTDFNARNKSLKAELLQ